MSALPASRFHIFDISVINNQKPFEAPATHMCEAPHTLWLEQRMLPELIEENEMQYQNYLVGGAIHSQMC